MALVLFGTASCGVSGGDSGTSDATSNCTPGRSVSCGCQGRNDGVQLCDSDGTWGDCQCGDAGSTSDDSSTDSTDTSGPTTDAETEDSSTPPDTEAGGSDAGDSGTDAEVPREPPQGAIDITERGADPNGGSIDDVLDQIDGCGETLYFPAGTYKLADYEFCEGETWFGDDATLVVQDFSGTLLQLVSNSTLNGFELDYSGSSDAAPTISMSGGGWVFKNVVFRGTRAPGTDLLYLAPRVASGGTGRMECIYLHEGNAAPDEASNGKPLWTAYIDGHLIIDGMWAEHWAENTLYMSNTPGPITVKNSFFRNTNVGIRVTEPAEFINTAFVHTGKQPGQIRDNGCCGGRSQRGVWWNAEKGSFGGDVAIRDSLFYYTHDEGSASLIDATDGNGGRLIVENSKFHNTTGTANIRSEGHTVDVRGTCMTGNGELSLGSDVANREITDDCTVQLQSPIPPPPPPGEIPTCPVGEYDVNP